MSLHLTKLILLLLNQNRIPNRINGFNKLISYSGMYYEGKIRNFGFRALKI